MEVVLKIALIAVLSYFVGSIPTAIIVSKRFFGFDIRTKGSGNMGSTNAFRILGWKWGLFVQITDILKGYLAVVLVAGYIGEGLIFPNATMFEHITLLKLLAGVSAVVGHIWSVFAGFKGGKGVNTAAGMLIGLAPYDVLIAFSLFALTVIFSGYISLGSIMAAFSIPSSMIVRYNIFGADIPGYSVLIYFALGLMVLVIYTHRANIKRLLQGNENKFSKLQLIKLKNKPKEEN
ncbi:MAG: glycerol-3-phosphate 1-O-acyltransferase PlsY [Candidatus Kapabacteria bacterium]|nr:glycerol-3-phosphate 1-O-acyltransferase PlsY [Ignavibacteriota bacterium]MCW5885570.1 glycerol-3-phosphate 1-O-acyltransferase PlsY [Candidatus Kapabacteria bacterium]